MSRSDKIKYGLILLLAAGVIVLLIVLFGGKKDTNQDLYNQLIAAKDSLIKKEVDKTALLERIIEEKERGFEVLQQRDSVLNAHYNEKDIQIKQLNNVIKNIPIRIGQLNNNADSIARAFADF